jgi:hypothetical protein
VRPAFPVRRDPLVQQARRDRQDLPVLRDRLVRPVLKVFKVLKDPQGAAVLAREHRSRRRAMRCDDPWTR